MERPAFLVVLISSVGKGSSKVEGDSGESCLLGMSLAGLPFPSLVVGVMPNHSCETSCAMGQPSGHADAHVLVYGPPSLDSCIPANGNYEENVFVITCVCGHDHPPAWATS